MNDHLFTIKVNDEIMKKKAYLKNHNVKFTHSIRKVIKIELDRLCKEFYYQEEKEILPF